MSTINITPFTDVLLVLLIIFIILASVTKEPKLPDAYNKDKVQPSQIVVIIDEHDHVQIGSNQVDDRRREGRLRAASRRDRPQVQERDHQGRSEGELRRHSAGDGRGEVSRPDRFRPGQSRPGYARRDQPNNSMAKRGGLHHDRRTRRAASSSGRSSSRSWRTLAIGVVFPNIDKHAEEQQTEQVTDVRRFTRSSCTRRRRRRRPRRPRRRRRRTRRRRPKQQVHAAEAQSQPRHKQHEQVRPARPKIRTRQPKNGSENGVPQGTGTAKPAAGPAGTPKPACANPNVEATVTNAVQPDYPESAKDLGLGAVTVEVEVTVGPSGNLVGRRFTRARATWRSIRRRCARRANRRYSPKLVDCSPTTGDYLFRADFQPD